MNSEIPQHTVDAAENAKWAKNPVVAAKIHDHQVVTDPLSSPTPTPLSQFQPHWAPDKLSETE